MNFGETDNEIDQHKSMQGPINGTAVSTITEHMQCCIGCEGSWEVAQIDD